MAFALHVEKYVKSDLKGLEIHNERKENYELSNKDIDRTKTHENYHIGEYSDNYVRKFNKIKKERVTGLVRENSIAGVGILVSADNEFFQNLSKEREKEFFNSVYNKVVAKYGKENVISAVVHKDETTPHMHIMLCPVTDDGRLTAKELFGRNSLRELQNIAVELQKEGFSIERGDSDRKVNHLSTEEFKLSQARKKLDMKKEEILEEEKKLEKEKNFLLSDKERFSKAKNIYSNVEKIKNEVLANKTFWYENLYKINSAQLEEIYKVAKNSEKILNFSRLTEKQYEEVVKEKDELINYKNEYEKLLKENRTLKDEKKEMIKITSKIKELGMNEVLECAKTAIEYDSLKFDYEKKIFFENLMKKEPSKLNSFEKNLKKEYIKQFGEEKSNSNIPKTWGEKMKKDTGIEFEL